MVTATVIPEAAWLIEHRHGPAAEARFLTAFTSPRFTIIDLIDFDYQRAIELIEPPWLRWRLSRSRISWA